MKNQIIEKLKKEASKKIPSDVRYGLKLAIKIISEHEEEKIDYTNYWKLPSSKITIKN